MSNTINIDGQEVTLKPIFTTLDESLRGAAYRKLIRACNESGDAQLQLLAEDTVAPWNFITTITGIESSGFNLPASSTLDSQTLLEGFRQWLQIPAGTSHKLLTAVEKNDYPDTDEAALPADKLSAEKKSR